MQKPRIKRMPTRSIFCDVDNTLIHWPADKYFNKEKAFNVKFMSYDFDVSPNDSNIKLVKDFYAKGYEIIIWSATGSEWASLISEKVGLKNYSDYCLSKPDFLIDDLRLDQFIIPEQILWKKPSGFEE